MNSQPPILEIMNQYKKLSTQETTPVKNIKSNNSSNNEEKENLLPTIEKDNSADFQSLLISQLQ